MMTLEQVIETTRTLPLEDRQRLQQWLREQEQQDAASPREVRLHQELEQYRRAKQWIAEHRAEYPGQWVALEGDRLISHGVDALEVHREAKAAGITAPFLERMIEEEGPYWGGWL